MRSFPQTLRPRRGAALAAALAGLLALAWGAPVRAQAPAQAPAPAPAQAPAPETDATGRPVSPEAKAAYERLLPSAVERGLGEAELQFILTALNLPAMDPGPFRDREALVSHFIKAGARVGKVSRDGLTGSDLWRLVRAARAAAQAYRIPPAVLICLTFCESGFNRRASAWTTSAKGVAQMTNPAAVETVNRIRWDPALGAQTREYAALLGAKMPAKFVGAPDVDELTRQLDALARARAPKAEVDKKRLERRKAILAHRDEPGHVYNIETNFGLAAAYLSHLRYRRLREIPDERKAWLTAVGAYNQGIGFANSLIKRAGGAAAFNRLGIREAFSHEAIFKLELSKERRQEMQDEVWSVRDCALP